MKGISTVIATLLMLVITVAIAITAYGYITGIFTGQTTKTIEIVDTTCIPGSSYTVTVRNTDQFNTIAASSDLLVRIDDTPVTTISWSPATIAANRGISTGTITNPVGGTAGTVHRVTVISPGGRPSQLSVAC